MPSKIISKTKSQPGGTGERREVDPALRARLKEIERDLIKNDEILSRRAGSAEPSESGPQTESGPVWFGTCFPGRENR